MKVLRDNNIFRIISNADIIEELPKGVFEVRVDGFGNCSLEKTPDIILPEKIYSNDSTFIQHVLKTWETSDGSLGVGLVGKKGLGKSFTSNILAKELDLPVIRIVSKITTTALFSFLNKIEQDFVLQIDEFEKRFDERSDDAVSQEDFLTFLDGGSTRSNRIFFMVTANMEYGFSSFLKNRPSRLRYYREYLNLSDDIIKEVIDDLLVNKDHMTDLIQHLPYEDLNIDVLIQIINEINLHDAAYSTFKSFFNYRRETHCKRKAMLVPDINKPDEVVHFDAQVLTRDYAGYGTNLGKSELGTVQLRDEAYFDSETSDQLYEAHIQYIDTESRTMKTENTHVRFFQVESKFEFLM